MPMTDLDIVTTARSLVDISQRVIDAVLARIAEVTEGGAGIDDNQVPILEEPDRPPGGGLRTDMADAQTARTAGKAAIGDQRNLIAMP